MGTRNILNICFLPFKKKWVIEINRILQQLLALALHIHWYKKELLKCFSPIFWRHPHTHPPTHPHTHTPTHPHTHTPTHPNTHTPTHPHTHTPTHPHTHPPTHPHTHTPTHPHTHTPTHP